MSWANLPTEILSLVRQRLFREDYFNFRATCRGWNFKADFDPVAYENVEYPFLVQFFGNGIDRSYSCCKAYSAAYDRTYRVRAPSRLLDAHIFCSKYGWLLLSRGSQLFFYHPPTERIIELPVPRSNADVPFQSMSFSTTPTSPDCVVIGVVDSESKKNSYFSIIRRGQRSWRHYSHVPNRMRVYNYFPEMLNTDNIKRVRVKPNACRVNFQKWSGLGNFLWSDFSSCPVFYKEDFYCLAQDGRLGIFHPKGKKANKMWRLLDTTKKADSFMDDPCNQAYLVECKGELISIVVAPMGEYVRMFKFYEPRKSWLTVHSLEDQTVLLNSTGCLAITCDDAKLKGLANTIHFPRLRQIRRHVFYSIPAGQFHTFRGDDTSHDLYDSKLLLGSAWVVPTFPVSYGAQAAAHWSSKELLQRPLINARKDRIVHPHYVIRNLAFLPPPPDGTYLSATQEEAPAGDPCFVFTNGQDENVVVSLSKEPIIDRSRDAELAEKIGSKLVLRSAHGRLALLDEDACSLLDPVSMIQTPLPIWEAPFFVSSIVLHLRPGDPKLLVMAFGSTKRKEKSEAEETEKTERTEETEETEKTEETEDNEFVAMVLQEGDDTWAVHKIPGDRGMDATKGVVMYRGKIYGLYPTGHLAMMDLQRKRHSIRSVNETGVEFPKSRVPGAVSYKVKLAESCGELLLLIRYYHYGCYVAEPDESDESVTMDIEVFEMDWEMMRWRAVEDLGDRAFFWSDWACYSCCASKSGFQKNSIYFLESDGAKLYMFDYRNRTISVSLLCPSVDVEYLVPEVFMRYK